MSLFHSIIIGGITGACLAFSVCMVKDISLADTIFRMFILGMGGAWVGFLLNWLSMILPKVEHHQEHHL